MSHDDEWRPGDPLDLDDGVPPPKPAAERPARPIAVGTQPARPAPAGSRTMIGPSVAPPIANASQLARGNAVQPPAAPARTEISSQRPVGARTEISSRPVDAVPRTEITGAPRSEPTRSAPPGTLIAHGVLPASVDASSVRQAPAAPSRGAPPGPSVTMTDPFARAPIARSPAAAPSPPRAILSRTPPAGVPATAPATASDASIAGDASADVIDLVPGARLGQFELIRELGRGGMGQVFLARDTRLARLVALKFLGHASRELTERFLVEARATARCQHENIVVIYEADEWQGKPYMALEYLEGEPLSRLIDGRVLAPSRALEIIVPVVRALARAHEHGIVHCDLKPDNIFVTREGIVKVLDFGIARALGKATDLAAGLVDSGISGTMPYMSPEQWGADEIDHRTDLWSTGIILWEMLTARHPLDPISQHRLILAASNLDQPMPAIGETMPDCPAALEQAIDRCLAKHKQDRFADANALLAALEPLLPGRYGRRLADEDNPFPGMTAFQEGDADRFFGRDRDVTHMVTRMADQPLVGVVAPSGVGKSSFLRAGVIPALKGSGESWEVFVTRPGRDPLAGLATLLQPIAQTVATDLKGTLQDHDALLARLRNEPGFLGTLLRGRARQKRARMLLFVDQFEELYTLCPDPDERLAYTAVLAGVADDAATPLRVVVSMRSDFLDRAAEDRVFMDRLTRGLLFLPPVDRAGMREALQAPLAMVGYRFERDGMADEMLDVLAGAPGALPLLQFTAAMLWDGRDRERRLLTAASYEAIGGVGGALATHADRVLAAMPAEHQKLARAIMLRLVTGEGTRAIVDVAELAALGDAATAAIDQLVAARLLVVQKREDGAVVEIVHESLLTRWPTLRRWLDESAEDAAFLEQLRTAAKQWDSRGRAQGLLWRGEAMEDARTFARRYKGELGSRERAYLDAVLDLATRATRRKRRLVLGAFLLLGGLLAAATVGIIYVRDAERTAHHQRELAIKEAARAREAEAKVTAQVQTIQQQLDTIKAKEAARAAEEQARVAAEANKAKVEESLATVETVVAEQEKDLASANKQLRKALAEAKNETKRAEDASRALEQALAHEKARVKELEGKMSQLQTKLR